MSRDITPAGAKESRKFFLLKDLPNFFRKSEEAEKRRTATSDSNVWKPSTICQPRAQTRKKFWPDASSFACRFRSSKQKGLAASGESCLPMFSPPIGRGRVTS